MSCTFARQVVHDIKIVSNLPALTVEEKLPSAVSDAALRAPEEIQVRQPMFLVRFKGHPYIKLCYC